MPGTSVWFRDDLRQRQVGGPPLPGSCCLIQRGTDQWMPEANPGARNRYQAGIERGFQNVH